MESLDKAKAKMVCHSLCDFLGRGPSIVHSPDPRVDKDNRRYPFVIGCSALCDKDPQRVLDHYDHVVTGVVRTVQEHKDD
jgi:hypothetical protein